MGTIEGKGRRFLEDEVLPYLEKAITYANVNFQEKDDLFQACALKLCKSPEKLDCDGWKTYVNKIVFTTNIDTHRREQYRVTESFFTEEGELKEPTCDRVKPNPEASDKLKRTLAKLSPIDRAIIRLYFVDKMKMREVSERLKVDKSTISRRIERVKNLLNNYDNISR